MDEIRVNFCPFVVPKNQMFPSRRTFLADTGMGVTGMALSAMLFRNGEAQARTGEREHFQGKAKSCIWIFNIGGVSHMESFDPKPMLNKYGGMSIEDTPYSDEVLDPEKINGNLLDPKKAEREVFKPSCHCRRATKNTARAASKSATGFRTWVRWPTNCPYCAACGPSTTITVPN